jgi:hypothetical protein
MFAEFDASQTQLNLVAVGYSLGLACSVLWVGAALVFFKFPKPDQERKLLMAYQSEDVEVQAVPEKT